MCAGCSTFGAAGVGFVARHPSNMLHVKPVAGACFLAFLFWRFCRGPWYMLSNVRSKTAKFWHLCTDDFSAVPSAFKIRLTLLDHFRPHY